MRILAYNIEFGGTGRLDAIHTVLDHANADVVALTEADDPDVVSTLAERLDVHHVWAKGSGERHIATLSRFPILAWHIYNAPPLTQAVFETRLDTPAGPITVYNAHLLPRLLLPFEIRRWQAVGKLLDVIHERRPGPHLIAGDLNSVAPGDDVLHDKNPAPMRRQMALQLFIVFRLAIPRLLKAGYVDCFRELHPDDSGYTFMPGNRTTRYDYILANPTMARALRACRVIDDVDAAHSASDHFPLLAEFDLSELDDISHLS